MVRWNDLLLQHYLKPELFTKQNHNESDCLVLALGLQLGFIFIIS